MTGEMNPIIVSNLGSHKVNIDIGGPHHDPCITGDGFNKVPNIGPFPSGGGQAAVQIGQDHEPYRSLSRLLMNIVDRVLGLDQSPQRKPLA